MTGLFYTLGAIGGLAGLTIGFCMIIFRDIIRKKIFPQLNSDQAYKTITLLIICTFLVTVLFALLWFFSLSKNQVVDVTIPDDSRVTADTPTLTKRIEDRPSRHQSVIYKIEKPPVEASNEVDYRLFLNGSAGKNDIAILILDANNRPVNKISSQIARLYKEKGLTVNTSLFSYRFFKPDNISNLQNADSQLLTSLDLGAYANHIVIGRYRNKIDDNGSLTKYISRADLEIVIISTASKSQTDSFIINASNGRDDIPNAEAGAIEKIIDNYKVNHMIL